MSRRRRSVLAGPAGVLLLSAPGALSAQWTEAPGRWWAKLSFFQHSTTEQYRADGEKRPFLTDGAESASRAVFLDALAGVTDRLDLWAQLPWFDLRFDDVLDRRRSSGVGDVRLSARYRLLDLAGGSIPVSFRYTVKVPVVDFPLDAEVIPVGEGQWDHEAWVEAGTSFWPVPAWAVLWVGYRWRLENPETTRDPGGERLLLAEVGGMLGRGLGGKVVVDALFGVPGAIQGVAVRGDEREIVYVQPTATWQAIPSTSLEVGVRIPLHGRNFPAGHQLTLALFHRGSGDG